MLIIGKAALDNGAHNNQRKDVFASIPDGWTLVPPELEEKAWGMLPFIELAFDEDGNLTDVAQGPIPEPEPEPEPEPTIDDRVTTLEETSATKDDIQAVWDSMAAAYKEGVETA